jgi:hypothetical protein
MKIKTTSVMNILNFMFWIGYVILIVDNFFRYPTQENTFLNFIIDPFQWIIAWLVLIALISMNLVLQGKSQKYTRWVTLILFLPFLYVFYELSIDIYSDFICSDWYLCQPIYPSTFLSYIGNVLVWWISLIYIFFLIFLSKTNKKTEE